MNKKTPALYEKIKKELAAYFYEKNDVATRCLILNKVIPLVDNQTRFGHLYDYLVVCDERNNPAEVIDRNSLNLDVYLKKDRKSEFKLVHFEMTKTNEPQYMEMPNE